MGGAQQPSLARQVLVDLFLVPHVIPGGDYVHAVTEDFIGKRGRDAEAARGIFAVGDHQVDIFSSGDLRQMPRDQTTAYRRKNVADEKDVRQFSGYFGSAPLRRLQPPSFDA